MKISLPSSVCYSPSPPVCQKILQCGVAMLLGDEDQYGTVLFHSVIYNSVPQFFLECLPDARKFTTNRV